MICYEEECDKLLSRFKIKFFKSIIHKRKLVALKNFHKRKSASMAALKMLNSKK